MLASIANRRAATIAALLTAAATLWAGCGKAADPAAASGKTGATKTPATKPATPIAAAAANPSAAAEAETAPSDAAAEAARSKADAAAKAELRDLAEQTYDEMMAEFAAGDTVLPTEVYRWSLTWMQYEMELATDEAKRINVARDHLDRMMTLAHAGLWRARELEYYVAEAEWLLDRLAPSPSFAATIEARRALEGEWEVTSCQEEGAAVKKPDIKTITILGRRANFEHRLGTAKALLTVDPTQEPATIDIFGLNEGFPFGGQGIYKLDGDRLTICWVAGSDRPKEFATKADDGMTMIELKKAR